MGKIVALHLSSLYLGWDHSKKADEPRLEKRRQEAIERVNRVDEMMVTALKNHLVV
jgi:hypothetical protein